MSVKPMTGAKEGWQAMRHGGRVYHYIRESMALCRGLGFYTADLVPDVPNAPRDNEDCAACFRLLRNEQKRKAKSAGKA